MHGGSLRTVKATEEWFQKPIWRYTTPHGSEFSKSKMIFSWKAIRGHFLNQLTWSIQIAHFITSSALVSPIVKAFHFFQAGSAADEDNESYDESDDEDLSEEDEEQESEELSEFGEKERFSISSLFVHLPALVTGLDSYKNSIVGHFNRFVPIFQQQSIKLGYCQKGSDWGNSNKVYR